MSGTSREYRPSRSPTARTDVPARLPGVSPAHPGHACQRASLHDAHVVTGRPHHLSPPWQSSLRRVQLCCCCSWTSWTTADGRVRRAAVRRRREAELVTAAMHIGYDALKVRALCTHAPCATRLAASIACPADRRPLKRDAFGLPLALLAGWELRRRSRGRQAHHRHGFRRSEVHHGGHRRAVAHQHAGGRMAGLMASLSAVGSRSRVAGGLPQPGRGLGRRGRAHGHFACACLSCTQLSTAFCAASASRERQKPAVPSTPMRPHVHTMYSQVNGSLVQS